MSFQFEEAGGEHDFDMPEVNYGQQLAWPTSGCCLLAHSHATTRLCSVRRKFAGLRTTTQKSTLVRHQTSLLRDAAGAASAAARQSNVVTCYAQPGARAALDRLRWTLWNLTHLKQVRSFSPRERIISICLINSINLF